MQPSFEILRPDLPRGNYKAVLFDFDGTLSLIREGWHRIMIALCVEELRRTASKETDHELEALSEEFVMALNGRPAIFQMARLAEEIQQRGGTAATAADYLAEYERRLGAVADSRMQQIRDGIVPFERWAVGGALKILNMLRSRGLKLYLASGTLLRYVRPEADILQITPFFPNEMNAPTDDGSTFTKRGVIERILRDNNLQGHELLSFGDGVVETQEVRRVGGTAVAVASDEPATGVNLWKRNRLVPAGADVVIADYTGHEELLGWLLKD